MESKIEIKPYGKNAKKHPKKQLEQIKASILAFGFNQPIVVDKSGVIIAGHGRYLAATELLGWTNFKKAGQAPKGETFIPYMILEDLTEKEVKAYRLADNKLNESKWDMELVVPELKELGIKLTELTGFDLDLLAEKEEGDDDIPDVPSNTKIKYGDIFELGDHRLMVGDATQKADVDLLMDGKQANMIFTDPPYNVNYEGGNGLKIENDDMTAGQFYQFLLDSFKNMLFVIEKGGAVYVTHADSEGRNFRSAFEDAGFLMKQCLIWVKNTMVLGRQDYQWQHEPILYGWKPGATHNWYGDYCKKTVIDDDIDLRKLSKQQLMTMINKYRNDEYTSVVRFEKPSRSEKHPTMKPVDLIMHFIHNSSRHGEIILDLFGGSGSTLIAAQNTDRRCFMMELDPRYADVIIQRYEAKTKKPAKKL
jgi:DNA modification methylase